MVPGVWWAPPLGDGSDTQTGSWTVTVPRTPAASSPGRFNFLVVMGTEVFQIPQKTEPGSPRHVSFQVLYSLLNQSENMDGWPRVVSEDIVKQVHRLKNEMFVMGGKIRGKTLLPIPEHLGSLDGTLDSMER